MTAPACPAAPELRFGFPEKLLTAFIVVSVLLWTLQCTLLQTVLSIDIYETIVWGEQLQWGYSKHPPLSGWLGYFFSWATGHRDWGMYLGAQLGIAAGMIFSYLLARKFFDRYKAAAATLLLYFLFYYTPSEMKFSTYFVEMAIAPAAAYFLLAALRENKLHRWLTFGVLCGLGLLNKYSFGLVMLGFAVIVLTRREYRKRLAAPGPYLAALAAAAILLPHAVWLVKHDFVCLRHVGERLEEAPDRLIPLVTLLATLYPLFSGALVTLLALFPGFRRTDGGGAAKRLWRNYRELAGWPREPIQRDALHFGGIMSLTPGLFYFALALTGQDIILMWLCPVAFWSGITVMALCPVQANRRFLTRIAVMLGAVIALVFAVTTIDLLYNTRDSLHLDRDALLREAAAVWEKKRGDAPIPLVVGGLRFSGVIDHYLPHHPPVCEPDNAIMIDLYRERLEKEGALLIDDKRESLVPFLKLVNRKIRLTKCEVRYRSLLGKEKKRKFVVGVLPPGTTIKPIPADWPDAGK